ncbi:MAG: MarR family winged helix-turn-helix transcriptional regulator [Syntrophales bacterium]
MKTDRNKNCRELFETIMTLAREIRCCSRDEAICQGLTFQQFIILDAVVRNGELGLGDLHRLLSVEKSTTTRLVNPLVQQGLLRRETAAHDSRAAKLTVTEAGVEIHGKAWDCLEGFFDGIAQGIPANQREEVVAAVKVFTSAMKRAAAACRCCG